VELSVHNEGTAIPPKMLSRLFDCLFRGSSDQRAADDNSTSLGLGLYIAKEIISAHGGTIEVQSTDDEGTTFVARLPPTGVGGAGNRGTQAVPSDQNPKRPHLVRSKRA
jgi:signal transduction histidine kinase